jgi:hypothetical protein
MPVEQYPAPEKEKGGEGELMANHELGIRN